MSFDFMSVKFCLCMSYSNADSELLMMCLDLVFQCVALKQRSSLRTLWKLTQSRARSWQPLCLSTSSHTTTSRFLCRWDVTDETDMCVNALAFLITSSCLPPPVSRDQPDQLHASVDACVDEFVKKCLYISLQHQLKKNLIKSNIIELLLLFK